MLDAYTASHTNGNQSIKSCVLNITKARRLQGAFDGGNISAYSAYQVREELRARAVVTCDSAKGNESKSMCGSSSDEDTFQLHLDGMTKQSATSDTKISEETSDESISPLVEEDQNEGLRQRRKGPTKDSNETESEWTVEEEPIPHTVDEDEMLRIMDPITLFGGLAPPALKEAQKNARQALSSYIEAANLAVYLLNLISEK